MSAKLSIITPVYNSKKSIKRCAHSILTQSNRDFEWIIVDDCSSDGTSNLLEQMRKSDSRIKIIRHNINQGASVSRIAGLQLCTAPYVTFVDADDAMQQGSIMAIISSIDRRKSDIYLSDSHLCLPRFRLQIPFATPSAPHVFDTDAPSPSLVLLNMLANKGVTPNMWDKVYRVSLFKQYMGLPPHLNVGEDLIVNMRLISHARSIQTINKSTYLWSYNGLGKKYYLERWSDYVAAIDIVHNELPDICQKCSISTAHAMDAAASNYLQCLRENIVQQIRGRQHPNKIESFAEDALQHPILTYSGTLAKSIVPNVKDSASLINAARRHLHSHKKYYIFTQILNLISPHN